jgi:hypothetical protein
LRKASGGSGDGGTEVQVVKILRRGDRHHRRSLCVKRNASTKPFTFLKLVETERFIIRIQKEPFDYTKWQENLFEDMTVEELSPAFNHEVQRSP